MKNYFKKENIFNVSPFILLFGILLFVHLLMPMYFGDYYSFSKILNSDYSQIFNFLINRYETWTSRILIDFFLVPLAMLPGIIWKVLNSLILLGIAFLMSKLFLNINKLNYIKENIYQKMDKSKNTFFSIEFKYNSLACFIFLFAIIGSYVALNSAGVVVTTINYIWPLFFGMLNFYLIIKYFFKNKDMGIELINKTPLMKKIFIYFILIFSLLFATNNEMMLCIMLGTYILTIIYCRIKKINIPKIIYFILLIIFFSFVYVLYSPGNSNRLIIETNFWFPTYNNLNTLDKILIGPTTLLNNAITTQEIPALLFSLVLGIYTYFVSNRKKIINTIISFIPILILGVFYVMSLLGFSSIIDFVKGGVTQYGLLFADLNTIIICIVLYLIITLSVLYTLFVIYKNKRSTVSYILFSLLLLSVGSVTIMGFSPTVWASQGRWFIYYYFLITFAIFLMIAELYLMDSFKKLVNFASFISIPISLLLYKLTFQHCVNYLKTVINGIHKIGNYNPPETIAEIPSYNIELAPFISIYNNALVNVITMSTLYLVLFSVMLFNVFCLYKYKFKKHIFIVPVLIILCIVFIGITPFIRHYYDNWFIYCTLLLVTNIILFVLNYQIRKNKNNIDDVL